MTRSARHFITETTLQSLSGHPVARTVWQGGGAGHGMGHIDLGAWAEVHAVVAASANLHRAARARLRRRRGDRRAAGHPRPAARRPGDGVRHVGAPRHAGQRGDAARRVASRFVGPVRGRLASGAEGEGRMAEVDDVVAAVLGALGDAAPG